jgi:hypothetical protein
MNGNTRFRFIDLVIGACIALLLASFILPVVFCSAGRSREAVCRNNLKLIGVGLELWEQHADRYPPCDWPQYGGSSELCPWLDALAMQKAYTAEKLEVKRTYLSQNGWTPEDFTKTIEDDKIFLCPSDLPHPHRINKERASAWAYASFEYSYTLPRYTYSTKYHDRADKQLLSADGVWPWSQNLSAEWVYSPGASWSAGGWWCNTVGYWHKKNSANFLLRDLHIENHKYPPDTTKVFEWESGETLYVLH